MGGICRVECELDFKQICSWIYISKLTGEEIELMFRQHRIANHAKIFDEVTVVPVRMNPLVKHEGTWFASWGG